MRFVLLSAAVGLGAVLLAGCGSNVCDKSDGFQPSTKVGDCSVEVPSRVLGPKAACNDALASCSDADKKILDGIMSCWDALPVCASADQVAWVDQSNGCYGSAANLSEACKTAYFGPGIPGADAGGDDAGVVDAGPQPDTDGGGALDLVLTADGKSVAMAWVKTQGGVVDHWEIHPFNAANIAEPIATVSPGETLFYQEPVGPGEKKKYFVVGFDEKGVVASGSFPQPEMDAGSGDAGMCMGVFDCPPEKVCNLGACAELPCNNPNVCPGGYVCDLTTDHRCERILISGDGGMNGGDDAGMQDMTSRQFISEFAEISTPADGGFSDDHVVSGFSALNIDLAAADTARQFMIMEQEGQVFGYFTQNRGKTWTTVSVDPIGTHPKLTYQPSNRTMFACYNAFGGVRVRKSVDYGKSWAISALDIMNAPNPDGGTSDPIQGCAMAPWVDGQILLTALDGDSVKVWTVKPDLTLAQPDPVSVFSSSANQFAPKDLDIATLPSDFMVHIVFTFSRPTMTAPDTEIAGYYRDSTTNGFVYKAVHNQPNAFAQSQPTVVIDPVTKRGVAAFVSNETASGGGVAADTIYLSFWLANKWATGPDLNIFARDNVGGGTYVNVPQRQAGEVWQARQPSLAAAANGRITLAFSGGKEVQGNPVLQAWSIPFDFNATNEIIKSIKGYYAADAEPVSPTRIARVAAKDTAGPAVAADSQISTYYGFVEGVGLQGDVPNRPVVISRPK